MISHLYFIHYTYQIKNFLFKKKEEIFLFLDNLVVKISALVGMFVGIELIAIAIFTVSVIYFRSPVVAGVIGNLSSLGMILGVILVFVKKEMSKKIQSN